MVAGSADLVMICDTEGAVLYANETAQRVMRVDRGDPAGRDLAGLLEPASLQRARTGIRPALLADGVWRGEMTGLADSTDHRTWAVTCQIHTEPGATTPFVAVVGHDITDLKEVQDQLAHQASHDPLTGLPNRALFQELGDKALARASRLGDPVAVLFVDLDRFKPVNDERGHAVGDALLVQVGERLRSSLRRGDVVARFGGDEFVVLCERPTGAAEMGDLAHRLLATLSAPVTIGATTVAVGASIGVALGAGEGTTIDTLIRDADAALYRAKASGRGQVCTFGDPA